MKIKSSERGITLITLVITIVIMIILAAVSLYGAFGKQDIVANTKEVMYKAKVRDLKELWETKIINLDTTNLNFTYLDDALGKEQIPEDLWEVFEVREGRLYYISGSTEEKQREWINDVGIYLYSTP